MIGSKCRVIFSAILVTLAVSIAFKSRHALAFSPRYSIHVKTHDALKPTIPLYMTSAVSNMTITTNSNDDDREDVQLKGSQLKPKMLDHEEGPVTAIHSIAEFLNAIENTKTNELVIVKFHAKFCRVCSRVILKYKKMASRLASADDTPVPIKFISVETTANPKIIEQLGVKKFPFLQIYRNKECVASFGTGPAHNFQSIVGDTIDQKLKMSQEDWEAFRDEFKSEISSSIQNLEFLRLESEIGNSCSVPTTGENVSP